MHGPVRPLHIIWPGPRNGSMAEITANPRIRQDTSTVLTSGPWALFRLLNQGRMRYRNHNNEIDDWRAWLDKQTWLHKTPTPLDKMSPDWLRLTPDFSHNISTLHTLPWSFVLNPGELAFSGKDWLIGVVSTSSDSVGRSYPLVIYQTVSLQWLKRYISVQKGWLFWLAQLVTNHVNVSDNSKKDLAETLDQLWDIHRPKLASWFDRAQINQQITCQQLIGQKEQKKLELIGHSFYGSHRRLQVGFGNRINEGTFWMHDV